MPHIFEPFFTSADGARGAGLGLAIARELAGQMRGELSVRSAPARPRSSSRCPHEPPRAARLASVAAAARSCSRAAASAATTTAATRRSSPTTRVEVIRSLGDGDGFDAQQIYKQEAPGVVTVVSLFGSDSLEDLDDASAGVGSGFVLNGEGEIATNAHVVTTGDVPDLRKAATVYVEFADGNQVEAEVRGYDPDSDIALLKVDPKGLTLRPLPLGLERRGAGRHAGRGDRLAVLRAPVALGRRRLGGRPLDHRR